jgi:hypothetical protein
VAISAAGHLSAPRRPALADRLIRLTTILAVDRPLPRSPPVRQGRRH